MLLFGLWLGVVLGTLIPLGLSAPLSLAMLCGSTLFTVVMLTGIFIWVRRKTSFQRAYLQWLPLGIALLSLSAIMLCVTFRIHERWKHRWPESMTKSPVVIEGWLDDIPRQADYGMRLSLRVTALDQAIPNPPEHVWLTAYATSRFSSTKERWQPKAGECWRLTVRLKPPHGLMNPHMFDVEMWLFSHGFDAIGSRVNRSPVERIEHCALSPLEGWMQQLQGMRQQLRNSIQQALGDAPYAGVIIALVVGDQPAIPEVQWQRFNATGIGHLISISGFHITFLAGFFVWIVRRAVRWFPRCLDIAPDRVWGAVAGLLVAVGYVLLAGGGIPAERTAWMMGLMTLGWSLGRWTQGGVLFAWASIGVLLMDSFAPLTAGFWLSFVGVGAIMLSGVGRLPEERPMWREALSSQRMATFALAPLTMFLFGQVSLVGPLANILAIPFISIVVTPLALFGALIPGMHWALQCAHTAFGILDHVLVWLTHISVFPALWHSVQPSLFATFWATLGCVYFCGPKVLPLRWVVGSLSVLPLWVAPNPLVSWGAARITVLDVGQGLSVLIETAQHRLLYDAGPRPFGALPTSGADAGARVILPFLRGEGFESLDTMLISHHDMDHRGGADTLLAQIPIRRVLTSIADASSFSMLTVATQYELCEAGQQWVWEGVTFSVLSPTAERLATETRSNDRSCVLKVASSAFSVLLPGDAESSVEDELLRDHPETLRSTVLIAGHHGSRSSTSSEWLAAVQPAYTVFTSGYINHYHHPHPEVIERVQQAGSVMARSDADGAIMFVLPTQGNMPLAQRWREVNGHIWNAH